MTALVLIPGMMCDARLFGPQIDNLSGAYDICLPVVHRDVSIAELARHVLVSAPSEFALCGLSLGGIIAMEILRQAPSRVTKLALLDTNHLPEEDHVKARRFRQMDAVRTGLLKSVMREEMKPNYLARGANREAILSLCMDMALGLGPHAFLRQSYALMDRPDQSDTLRRAKTKTLVLCGAEDRLCPVLRHEHMVSLLPNATLEVVEKAGHLPTLEQPKQTIAALRRWLEEK